MNISNQTVAAAFANFLSAGGSQTDAFAIFPDGRRAEARSVFGYQRNCWPAIRSSELVAESPPSPSSFAKAMEDGRLPTSLKLRWTPEDTILRSEPPSIGSEQRQRP